MSIEITVSLDALADRRVGEAVRGLIEALRIATSPSRATGREPPGRVIFHDHRTTPVATIIGPPRAAGAATAMVRDAADAVKSVTAGLVRSRFSVVFGRAVVGRPTVVGRGRRGGALAQSPIKALVPGPVQTERGGAPLRAVRSTRDAGDGGTAPGPEPGRSPITEVGRAALDLRCWPAGSTWLLSWPVRLALDDELVGGVLEAVDGGLGA